MSTKVKLNENAKKWVAALRSGKYKQTQNRLASVDSATGEVTGYCCLGVACELAKAAGVDIPTYVGGGGRSLFYGNEETTLPSSVQRWLGVDDDEVDLKYAGKDTSLAGLNDGGKSFKQIARIIEQKAKELFV